MNSRSERDELAEAIGRVAIAASYADVTVRTCVGVLGGAGARLLADEQDSISRLVDWCTSFRKRLYSPPDDTSQAFDVIARRLKDKIQRRNTIIHGLWFSPSESVINVSNRKRGTGHYKMQPFEIAAVKQLASDITITADEFERACRLIARLELLTPGRPPSGNDGSCRP